MKFQMMKLSTLFGKYILTAMVLSVSGLFTTQLMAQSYPGNGAYNQNNRVVVYKDCNYRGERREVPVGEYRSLKNLKIDNDSVSSMQIPQGLELTIFENDNFGGSNTRITQDVPCLDRNWNDKTSSLSVRHINGDNYSRNNSQNNSQNSGSYENRDYQNRGADNRGYNDRSNQNNRRYGANQSYAGNDAKVTGNNIVFVGFSGVALSNVGNKQWRSTNNRGQITNFREMSRDENAVYLESTNAPEKLKIDLFTNQVTTIDRDGRQYSFPITSKQAAAVNNNVARSIQSPRAAANQSSENRTIRNGCFNYKAYTRGGEAGIRFHGHEGFNRFTNKAYGAKLCHKGTLSMELSKTQPGTEVIVEIDGNRYVFAANDQGDSFQNNWYRKVIRLNIQG